MLDHMSCDHHISRCAGTFRIVELPMKLKSTVQVDVGTDICGVKPVSGISQRLDRDKSPEKVAFAAADFDNRRLLDALLIDEVVHEFTDVIVESR